MINQLMTGSMRPTAEILQDIAPAMELAVDDLLVIAGLPVEYDPQRPGLLYGGGREIASVGEHHRQIHRDPARVMTRLPNPQRAERVAERAGQPGSVGEVSKQAGAGMPDNTPTISSGNNLRT
jgi:hypothetical protein